MAKRIIAIAMCLVITIGVFCGCSPKSVSVSPSQAALGTTALTNSHTMPAQTDTVPPQPLSLNQVKPYYVVKEGNLANEDNMRIVGLWYITAPEANSFEEYAQTAIRATLDLYSLYRNDFTEVLLILQRSVKTTYAQAFYASDGKGAWGMTGSVPAVPKYWHVRAMDDLPYNTQELAIMELWQNKLTDFPNHDSFSSLSYDENALRHYIADTLHIPYSETQVRPLKMVEYKVDESFERNPSGREVLPDKPQSKARTQYPKKLVT